MKLLNSTIFDIINSFISFVQSKANTLRENSFLLNNINIFILFFIILTYILSAFAPTSYIGIVSFFVPLLVILKVLITKGEKIELELCNFYLLIYLLICFITNFTSSMPCQSFYGFMKTFIYFAFYFALCQFLKNNQKYIIPILCTIGAVISIESIIGLFQNSIGLENISTWQDTSYINPEDVLSRIYGTLKPYNPNLFGGYLISGISIIFAFLALSLKNKNIKMIIISLICAIASLTCVFLTGCRGAYLALILILAGIFAASFQIIFYDFKIEKLKKLWGKITLFCIAVGCIFLVFNHGILQRFLSIFILRGDSSTSFRMNVYNSAVQMFQDNWFFGIGVGNKVFREIYGLYMLSGFDALSCYCIFLEMAVESGIFALISYLLFAFSLLYTAFKKFIISNDFNYKILLFTSFISILAVMFHGIFDTIYFRPQVQYIYWTMAAILTVLVREDKMAV